MSESTIVPKNQLEVVVVQPTRYNDYDLLDARVWLLGADGEPEKPTKKGLCLRPEVWRKVLPALRDLAGERDHDE